MTAPPVLSLAKKALLAAAGACVVATTATAQPTQIAAPSGQPADAKQQALNFVQTYAAFSPTQVAARWRVPVCLQVGGLAPAQAAAILTRVAQVIGAAGVRVQTGKCRSNVEIEFTPDPQKTLDEAAKRDPHVLGDAGSAGAVTLPVQAWYLTNGGQYASAGQEGMKILTDWQTTVSPYSGGFGPYDPGFPGAQSPDTGPNATRQFLHVIVIVDLQRIGNSKLGPIADEAAMLALSQPRSLGQCQTLPSVTDLSACSCPGRAAPSGLTQADYAYLAALYSARPSFNKIVDLMADILVNPEGASDRTAENRLITGSRLPGPSRAGFSVPGPVAILPN